MLKRIKGVSSMQIHFCPYKHLAVQNIIKTRMMSAELTIHSSEAVGQRM